MAKMLMRDLNEQERAVLANLTFHEGWKILTAMFGEMCDLSTKAVIQLDPSDERYDERLRTLQMTARITNDVCSSILRSVGAHTLAYAEQRQEEDAVQEIASKMRYAMRPVDPQ